MAGGSMFSVVHQSIWGMPWGPGMKLIRFWSRSKHIFGLYSTNNLIIITGFYTNVWADDILYPKGNGRRHCEILTFCQNCYGHYSVSFENSEWNGAQTHRTARQVILVPSTSLVSLWRELSASPYTKSNIQHVIYIKLHYLNVCDLNEQIPNYGNESSNKPFPLTIVNNRSVLRSFSNFDITFLTYNSQKTWVDQC